MDETPSVLNSLDYLQSGTLYQPWGWYLSEKANQEKLDKLREATSCQLDDIYECFEGKTGAEVVTSSPFVLTEFHFHPMSDESFFPADIMNETYREAKRCVVSVD